MTIQGIPGVGDLGLFDKIEKVGEKVHKLPRVRGERISIRPRPYPAKSDEDKLEEAAMQGVPGTLPERIVWKWLDEQGYRYITQGSEFGGRLVMGGAVVDFLVYDMSGLTVALRVQGDYWHGPTFPGRQARDDEQFARLTARGYLVVDLWESDIYEAVLQDRLTAYITREVQS